MEPAPRPDCPLRGQGDLFRFVFSPAGRTLEAMPLAAVLALTVATWFGPAQASFDATIPGNPYDYLANDVRVVFAAPDGHREERLAYFDEGHWKAWLTTMHPGHYRATLQRNGEPLPVPPADIDVPETARLPEGFVHVQGTRFVTDAGTPYFPLGHDLAWRYPDIPPLPELLHRMGAAGINWTRIWACAWDGKNPILIRHNAYSRQQQDIWRERAPLGEFLPAALRQWDEIVAAAEASGIRFQFVLFHHGLVSTRADANWDEHPWSKANGGFLDKPQEFFTNETAREYSRRWLRYAIARWGHSPSVLTWELFNEVEWSDAIQKDHDWPAVIAWHNEMAAFVRSLDPYHHLVTTSSAIDHPELYATMDYYQPHAYPREVFTTLAGTRPLPGKPWFYAESGRGIGEVNKDEGMVVRDGLWAGMLGGHAGGACYWFWERVTHLDLYSEFAHAARILQVSQLPARTQAHPAAVEIVGGKPAPLVVAPGRGRGASVRFRFELPADTTPAWLTELSAMFGTGPGGDPAEPAHPVEFAFSAPAAGQASLVLAAIAGAGGGLRVSLDGREIFRQTWPALPDLKPSDIWRRQPAPPPLAIAYPTGAHIITLEGLGPAWVQVDRLIVPDIGCDVCAHAIADRDFALVRVQADEGAVPATVGLRVDGLGDGPCRLNLIDLATGAERQQAAAVKNGLLPGVALTARDTALVVAR